MAQSPSVVVDLAEKLANELSSDRDPQGRIGKVKRYLHGDHDLPYAPDRARQHPEYRTAARKAITNWLPRVSDTFTQGLFVDGYRSPRSGANSPVWDIWRANGMPARQTITTRGALDYGVSYGLTLPGAGRPVMRALPATRSTAFYADEDDEWPLVGLHWRGANAAGESLYEAYDDEFVYDLVRDGTGTMQVRGLYSHGLGVCPLTRFRTRLGGASVGVVYPLITVQDRVNETVFALMVALQFASFRQRWAKGISVAFDDAGNPIAPFEAAVDRLWTTDNPDASFGDFAQTQTSDHLQAYNSAVRTLAALGAISPNVLTGDLINLSADALAQIEQQTQAQLGEYETLFGESYEQWLRLAALAAGDTASATDITSSIRWRDTEARSLAATVDALGKMVTMLQIPPSAIWDKVPGVTDSDIERFKAEAGSTDGLALLAAALDRQSTPSAASPSPFQAGAA